MRQLAHRPVENAVTAFPDLEPVCRLNRAHPLAIAPAVPVRLWATASVPLGMIRQPRAVGRNARRVPVISSSLCRATALVSPSFEAFCPAAHAV